jgi:hypothetical protein
MQCRGFQGFILYSGPESPVTGRWAPEIKPLKLAVNSDARTNYSYLRATIGSVLMARRAGI